jgi:hypothetical protein
MGKAKHGKAGVEVKVRVPDEIMKKVDAIAAHNYTTRSEVIRQACIEYVNRLEAQQGSLYTYPPHRDHVIAVEEKTVINHPPKPHQKPPEKLPGKHAT